MGDNMKKVDKVKYRIRNKKEIKENKKAKQFNYFVLKFFVVLLIFSLGTLLIKNDNNIKNKIYKKIYNNNLSFAYFKNSYNKYIGNIIPFKNIFVQRKVFSQKLQYKTLSKYNKGVKLTLSDNYPIPVLKGGIVIFNGRKDYKNTIIIQQSDGIDVWYSNIANTNLKLYDYIEDDAIIGEAKNNKLYLTFYKDGIEIDYKEVFR